MAVEVSEPIIRNEKPSDPRVVARRAKKALRPWEVPPEQRPPSIIDDLKSGDPNRQRAARINLGLRAGTAVALAALTGGLLVGDTVPTEIVDVPSAGTIPYTPPSDVGHSEIVNVPPAGTAPYIP